MIPTCLYENESKNPGTTDFVEPQISQMAPMEKTT